MNFQTFAGSAILATLAVLGGCSTKSAQADGASSATAKATSKATASSESKPAAPGETPMGGELDVQVEDGVAAKIKVGSAFADLYPRMGTDDDGNPKVESYQFNVRAFNSDVKDATCETELSGDKAVGGTNWAILLRPGGFDDRWEVGTKDPVAVSVAFFHKDDKRTHGEAPWATYEKNEMFVEALTEKSVTLRVDLDPGALSGDRGKGWVRGKITAKICKNEK